MIPPQVGFLLRFDIADEIVRWFFHLPRLMHGRKHIGTNRFILLNLFHVSIDYQRVIRRSGSLTGKLSGAIFAEHQISDWGFQSRTLGAISPNPRPWLRRAFRHLMKTGMRGGFLRNGDQSSLHRDGQFRRAISLFLILGNSHRRYNYSATRRIQRPKTKWRDKPLFDQFLLCLEWHCPVERSVFFEGEFS